ncbi:hypothetical protein [Aquibium sp. ELW1220]|uniref:hypothetical protein n=1 Tax=Aquibium sp. ELW1220 TaxID=2976766 RepID=UPI0025B0821D|nr:hypothetical protein [Aquibium sp. ELW1220]MDN2578996.1 hypothetical protein [Aquibium sp. ELW1220]
MEIGLTDIVDNRAFERPVLFTSTMDLLAATPPFKGFELESMVRSVQFQIDQNTCLFAIDEGRMAGYIGWILTSQNVVDEWRYSGGILRPAVEAEVIVVTIIAVQSPKLILPLIRKAKTKSKGLPVYWKRMSPDGQSEVIRSVP